ncbi:MAG: hypothetical protein PUF78_11220, partial [Lachnospiraceae bacterium]|nr:hypothetical protein [Lachnospiraceae bacterium]
KRYVESFPNAKQENLFIGMIHSFQHMGIPEYVLADNMKSVVVGRDADGHPIWNHDYEAFMEAIGFKTKLCKPKHPFTYLQNRIIFKVGAGSHELRDSCTDF